MIITLSTPSIANLSEAAQRKHQSVGCGKHLTSTALHIAYCCPHRPHLHVGELTEQCIAGFVGIGAPVKLAVGVWGIYPCPSKGPASMGHCNTLHHYVAAACSAAVNTTTHGNHGNHAWPIATIIFLLTCCNYIAAAVVIQPDFFPEQSTMVGLGGK